MQRVPLWGTLYFLRGGKRNAEWKEGAAVTAEDIIASLKPLVDEYFVGSCEQRGETLVYVLPDGRKFHLTAAEK